MICRWWCSMGCEQKAAGKKKKTETNISMFLIIFGVFLQQSWKEQTYFNPQGVKVQSRQPLGHCWLQLQNLCFHITWRDTGLPTEKVEFKDACALKMGRTENTETCSDSAVYHITGCGLWLIHTALSEKHRVNKATSLSSNIPSACKFELMWKAVLLQRKKAESLVTMQIY